MATLFNRRCSLIVGARRIENLRIAFSVERNDKREPNKAAIAISNLSSQTRALIENIGQPVILEAGYVDDSVFGVVFSGDAFRVQHDTEGPDVTTTIEAADGGEKIKKSVVSASYGKGASVVGILRDIVGAMGLPLSTGSVLTPSPATVANGWAFAGVASRGLDKLCEGHSLTWSVLNGQVIVLVAGNPVADTSAVSLSASSGMIGSPSEGERDSETKRRRFIVRSLMIPSIRPGGIINVSSFDKPGLSGLYVVRSQKIKGDTHGAEWEMEHTLEIARGVSLR